MDYTLEEQIEMIREEMMSAAIKNGLKDDETIRFSRKLDSLINQYEEQKENTQ
ncbi:MAG: aspartyl-phosphate phosphatase Spo0E family protein [Sporosarcina sp.]